MILPSPTHTVPGMRGPSNLNVLREKLRQRAFSLPVPTLGFTTSLHQEDTGGPGSRKSA